MKLSPPIFASTLGHAGADYQIAPPRIFDALTRIGALPVLVLNETKYYLNEDIDRAVLTLHGRVLPPDTGERNP